MRHFPVSLLLLFLFLVSFAFSALAKPEQVSMRIKRVMLVNDAPAVLLVDSSEDSFLLVFIDFFMANSIRMGMEPPSLERPMTHDLMGIFLRQLGASLKRIDITELKNNTYYALITLEIKGKSNQIDARPSDALALAVRNKTPVFVHRKLIQRFDRDSEKKPKRDKNQEPTRKDAGKRKAST